MNDVLLGIMIPFLGTTLGAGCVFFLRGKLNLSIERGLTGFAAGIMVAASFFSLLIPALNETTEMGICTSRHWFWYRHGIFALAGSSDSTSSHACG